jgi:hypothetical protein
MANNATGRTAALTPDLLTSQPVGSWTSNPTYNALLLFGGLLRYGGPDGYIYEMFDAVAPGTTFNDHWQMRATSNGSFYLVPGLASKTVEMRGPWSGDTVTLAAEGAGIAVTLLAFGDMAMGPRGGLASEAYNRLLAFAQQHRDAKSIRKLL